ncbi:MAG TPA: hypothetical protein VGJ33_09035 [Candidatus Angelobacter sp.]
MTPDANANSSTRFSCLHRSAVIKISLAASALLILAGCGGVKANTASPTPTPNPSPSPTTSSAAPTVQLVASPATVAPGGPSTLTWSSTNATAIIIDNNVGTEGPNGSIVVMPSATTTYTAKASGPGGTQTTSAMVTVSGPPLASGSANVLTWHMDNGRSGLNSGEATLTPANVNPLGFGKLFSYSVDSYMYAQPLYASGLNINGATHNVVFAATEKASVYAFDADNFGDGSPLWKVSLLQAGETPQAGGNPKPFQGLTSTPAIDLSSKTMYVFTSQKNTAGSSFFRLHAISILNGQERAGSPVVIHASVPGTNAESVNGVITLTPACLQRAALLLSGGTIYLGFSACPTGWVLAYDAASLTQTGVLNMSPNADGYGQFGGAGGVWMGGGGPVADEQGNVYLTTGNGPYDGGPEWGDSVLRVDSHLNVVDHFTPQDFAFLQCRDLDLSSGGALLIPGQQRLLVGGKAGHMYLLNTTSLGGVQPNDAGASQSFWFTQNSHSSGSCVDNHSNTVIGDSAPYAFYATAAWFNGSAYIAAAPGPLRQFLFQGGQFVQGPSASTVINPFSYGGTPFISANGTQNGIVWMIDHVHPVQDPFTATPSTAVLHAYDATDLTHELYNSSQNSADAPGFGIKFTAPIVANGKVFMGTAHDPVTAADPQGELDVYGLKQ